jgi:hypothetical protein
MKHLQSYKLFESRFTDDYDFSEHNFNCGDCDVYAIALHRVYGYPLYIVNGYHKEDDWDEEEGYTEYDSEPAHIVVKLPNGNYMDSDGEVTEDQLKTDCAFGNKIEYIKIEPITEQEAMYVYSGEDQEEDIERVVKHIRNKEKISESLVNRDINKEDIKSLFVEITDLDFNTDVTFLRYNHPCAGDYVPDFHDGFRVFLKKIDKERTNKVEGCVSLESIYDTLSVAEEYILDVYDKPLTRIYVWYVCMNNSIRVMSLDELVEVNKSVIENYDNPLIYQLELTFDRQKPKEEPVSKVKKFFDLFKKK